MEPTARAREIAPLISAAIEQIEAALNLGAGFDPAKSAGIFTAGMAEYAEVALVGRSPRAFAEEAPRATLRLSAADRRRCRRAARARRDRCRGRASARTAGGDRIADAAARPVCRDHAQGPSDRGGRPLSSRPMRRRTMCWSRRAATPPARSTASSSISGCGAASRCWSRPIWRCRRRSRPPISSPRCRAAPRARSPPPPRSRSCHCRSIFGDRVDGLAPPRRQRAGAGLVPSAPDGGGTGRGLTRLSRAAFFGSASGSPLLAKPHGPLRSRSSSVQRCSIDTA